MNTIEKTVDNFDKTMDSKLGEKNKCEWKIKEK